MTERLSDISARIDGIRQLGAVVNAMRGIAAARAQQARSQLAAVDSYAATIALAIGRTLASAPAGRSAAIRRSARPAQEHIPIGLNRSERQEFTPAFDSGSISDRSHESMRSESALVLFCAEQGFAGAFSERVLDAVKADLGESEIFLIGARGLAVAAERGLVADWSHPMPSHSLGIPKLADRISEALYARIAAGKIDRLDAVFSQWRAGRGIHIERQRLFPLDMSKFSFEGDAAPPLMNLTAEALLIELAADYVHAQLCKTALHAFAAENEARMEAMAAARGQIERQLSRLQGLQRVVRQEEITAEIIELAAGERASRSEETGR